MSELPTDQIEITVNTVMSRWDYSKLRAYYLYRIHPGRMRNLMVALAVAILLVAGGRFGFLPSVLYQTGVVLLVTLTGVMIYIDSRAKKLEKPGKSIGNRPQKALLSASGFTVEWMNYNVPLYYTWEAVQRAVESDQHFFLFVDKLAAIILPKRGMPLEKVDAVRDCISSRIPAERVDLSGCKL